MLSSRLKNILRELMAADIPLTGTYLSNLNQVTTRTTREDIKNLDALLKDNGALINSVISKGYQLEIIDEPLFKHFLKEHVTEEKDSEIPNTPEMRFTYIIRRLLLSEGYLKLDDLADELYVSKSTIQQDLKQVKQLLSKYSISLESRPNQGIKVVGSEVKLRFCLSEYIFDRNELKNEKHSILDSEESDMLKEQMLDIIMRQIRKYQITLSDIAINNLLIHLLIAFKRIKSNHYVAMFNKDIHEIEEQEEYQVALEIVKEIEKVFNIDFPKEEIAYIAMHLLGTKILMQNNHQIDDIIEDENLKIVKFILSKIEDELDLDIKDDQELLFGLSMHLKPAINRIKYGMNMRNPMLQDIKNNYPLAFEAGIIAGLAIKEITGTEIDENEIGYIALHLGAAIERKKLTNGPKRCLVVCASGLGTAQLIYYKLKSFFGNNLEVVDTTEYYKLNQYNFNDIDFIVSSIPIQNKLDVPVIEVNAILRESDLKAIEKFISNHKLPVQSYFIKDLMFFKKAFENKEHVLGFLENQLISNGLVKEGFLESVYKRENVAPTSFGNLVAIPHPIKPQTDQTFLAVCTLEKPISWSGKPAQLIFLLCVKKNSQEDLQGMYDVLGKIIENNSIVQELLKVSNYDEFMKAVQSIEK